MQEIITALFRVVPTTAWYIFFIGSFLFSLVLLILVACVPQAGERIANFLQRVSNLWFPTKGRQSFHRRSQTRSKQRG